MPTSFSFTYPKPVLLTYFKKIEPKSILFKIDTLDIGSIFTTLLQTIITSHLFAYLTDDDCASLLTFINQLKIKTEKLTELSPIKFTNNEQIKKLLSLVIYTRNETLSITKKMVQCEATEIQYIHATYKTLIFMMHLKSNLGDLLSCSELQNEYTAFILVMLNDIHSIASNISTGLYTNHFIKDYLFLINLFKEVNDIFQKLHTSILSRALELTNGERLLVNIMKCGIRMPFYQAQYYAALGEDNRLADCLKSQQKIHFTIEKNPITKEILLHFSTQMISEHEDFKIELEKNLQRAVFIDLLTTLETQSRVYYHCVNSSNTQTFKNALKNQFYNLSGITEVTKNTLGKIDPCIAQLQLTHTNHYFSNQEILILCKRIIIKLKIIFSQNKYSVIAKKIDAYLAIYSDRISAQEKLLSPSPSLKPIEQKKTLPQEIKTAAPVETTKVKTNKKKRKKQKNIAQSAKTINVPEPLKIDHKEQLKQLQEEITQYEAEIQTLTEQNATLQIKHEQTTQKNTKTLENQIEKEKKLQETITILENKISSLSKDEGVSKAELVPLQAQNKVLETNNFTYQKELTKTKKSIEKLEIEYANLVEKYTLLKQSISTILPDAANFLTAESNYKKIIESLSQAKEAFNKQKIIDTDSNKTNQALLQTAMASQKSIQAEINELTQTSNVETQALQNQITELENTIQHFQKSNIQLHNACLSTKKALQQLNQHKQTTDQTNLQLYRTRLNMIRTFYKQCSAHIADLESLSRMQAFQNPLSIQPAVPGFMPFYGLYTQPPAPCLQTTAISSFTEENNIPLAIPATHYRYPQTKGSD